MKTLLFSPITLGVMIFALFATITGANACKKPTECKAIVYVVHETTKAPIANATVTLYCDLNNCIVEQSDITGLDGTAEFSFENPTILHIKVNYDGVLYDGKYIKLLAGETAEEIVELPL